MIIGLKRSCKPAAFTLIELLLVMVIMTILASVTVIQVQRYNAKAKIAKAKTDIHLLETAVGLFQLDSGRYPSTDEGLNALVDNPNESPDWSGPYVKLVPTDPWGDDYLYHSPGTHLASSFDLYSAGPDRQEGNEDDVVNWKQ